MGRICVELEECVLLLECAQKIGLSILHLVNLEGGSNDMFDVDMSFGVGICIYHYFECFLIYLTTREMFWVLVDDSIWRFDGGSWVKNFNSSEDNNMLLCKIYSLFLILQRISELRMWSSSYWQLSLFLHVRLYDGMIRMGLSFLFHWYLRSSNCCRGGEFSYLSREGSKD